jgi:hypothetical protein
VSTPAGRIQQKIIRHAKRLGFLVKRHYNGPGVETGWPDLEIVLRAGRCVWVEVKAPGDRLRARQVYIIEKLRALGHTVIIAEDAETVIARLEDEAAAAEA